MSAPTPVVCIPFAPAVGLGIVPSESVPHGSQAVRTPVFKSAPLGRHSGPARPASKPASARSRTLRHQRTEGPSPDFPHVLGREPPSSPPGPVPGQASSTAHPSPPGADPDPGPRLRHRGLRALAHKRQQAGSGNMQPQNTGRRQQLPRRGGGEQSAVHEWGCREVLALEWCGVERGDVEWSHGCVVPSTVPNTQCGQWDALEVPAA